MPHLPFDISVVRIVDIDGTIFARQELKDYFNEETKILNNAVSKINEWFEAGNYILFWTSRPESYRSLTMKQLDNAGFKYHELLMNKPHGKVMKWYDDKEIKAYNVDPNKGIFFVKEES